MGIIIKQSIRNASLTYVGIGLGLVSTIFLFPHILGAEKYGLTRSLIAITTISSQIITLGIPNTLVKFIPNLASDHHLRSTFFRFTIIPSVLLLSIYLTTFFLFEAKWLALYNDSALLEVYLWLVLPMVFATTSFSLFSALVKASLDTVFATFLQDVFLRVTILIFLLLYFLEILDFHGFMLGFVGAYVLNMLILVGYSLRMKYFSMTRYKGQNTFNPKEIFSYSFFAFFSGFTMILVSNIDLIMVDMFEGLETAGVYALAMYVGTVITVPRKSISKIIHPILTKAFKDNNITEIKRLYVQSSTNQLLIALIIYIGILTSLDDLYQILPDEFSAGKSIIMILGLAYLFDLATGANGQIIITSHFYKFDFISSLLLMACAVVLNYLLIPIYGITGAALATASSVGLYNIIKTIFVWFMLKMQPFKKETLYNVFIGALCFILGEYISLNTPPIITIFIRSMILGSMYICLAYVLNISPELNATLKEYYHRYLIKKQGS